MRIRNTLKILLIVLAFQIVAFILLGISGMFLSQNQPVKELSFGLLSLGIGMIGMLKSALEMAANHRQNPVSQKVVN